MSNTSRIPELGQPILPVLDPTVDLNTNSYTDADTFSNGSSKSQQQTSTQQSFQNSKEAVINSESLSAPRTPRTPPTPPPNHPAAAQSAMADVANHPVTQNIKKTINDAPVTQTVKAEASKTQNEFADLANARTPPKQPAATGQPLTAYHSLFYRLLSWKNPRATAISFVASIAFIFAARYLNVFRYLFKVLYIALGTTAAAEIAGRAAFGTGLTTQIRPKKYFTIPKASLERLLDDVEQFINFFVIESQRVFFAENVYVTGAAFFASLVSYLLIKFVPLWGLTLIATTVAYLGPLVYIQNKEAIDSQLERAGALASQQATQIRDIAAQQTEHATKTFQNYAGEYTQKAQETINQYRGRSSSPEVKKEHFPAAPKTDLRHDSKVFPEKEFVAVRDPIVASKSVEEPLLEPHTAL